MRLLWNRPEPLSCTEIVNASSDKHWKDSYVHALVKSLIKKGYIKVVAFELASRIYARKFAPSMDYGHFVLQQVFTPEQFEDKEYMIEIWRKLIMKIEDVTIINKIKQIIKNIKKAHGIITE